MGVLALTFVAVGLLNAAAAFSIDPYIVGGQPAYFKDYPFLVMVLDTRGDTGGLGYVPPFCGGTILNENWILTAAHCATGTVEQHRIYAGIENFSETWDGYESAITQVSEVSKIILHEEYDSDTMEHDIALIKLSTPLQWTDYIQAGKLATANTVMESMLQVGGMLTFFTTTCAIRWLNVPLDGTCCTLSPCVAFGTERPGEEDWINTFIYASFIGSGCTQKDRKDRPGIYTKVSHYSGWIATNIV